MKKCNLFKIIANLACLMTFLCLFSANAVAADHSSKSILTCIKNKKELVVGTSADYPPLEFIDNQNGTNKYVGVDIELAKEIAKDLGVKLVVKNMSFDSLLVALETRKVDMVISGLTSGEYFLINKNDRAKYHSLISFKGQKIGAQNGSLQYQLVKKQMPKSHVKGLGKINTLVLALQSGKVSAVVMEELIAKAYAHNNPSLYCFKSDLKEPQAGNAIAVAKNQPDLLKEVNKTVDKVIAKKLVLTKFLPQAAKSMKKSTAKKDPFKYAPYFIKGIELTLVITIFSVLIGVILGTILALMRLSSHLALKIPAICYIELIRGTPQMVQILFVYFGIGAIIQNMSALLAGIIAIGLNSGAYVAEDIRSGINSLPVGQAEAARSLGLSKAATYRYVVIPQAIKNIWPALGNEFITLLKDSSLAVSYTHLRAHET
ncbi:MAG: ABC transporter substrate-binding protein/permease, partial [Lactobacillus iners]|nr:ABC transporter substrate-binding protein/permease [Lactobacillus iners]